MPPGLPLVPGFEPLSPHLQNWTDCPCLCASMKAVQDNGSKAPYVIIGHMDKNQQICFVTLVHPCVSLRAYYNILYTVGAPYVFLGLH